MGVHVVTGAASGMGYAAAQRLRNDGHRVITVDRHEADITADLSTSHGRAHATETVLAASDGHLDGAVMAAGVGPRPGRGSAENILSVNYFGVVELAQAWRPALSTAGRAKVVVVGSNSATTMPMVPGRAVRALLRDDLPGALRAVRMFGSIAPAMAYGASKIAVTRWVRRTAVQPMWAGEGVRLNAIVPGAIDTPLLGEQLATPRQAKAVRGFPVPVGGFGDPDQIAAWIHFMLTDDADFLCGSVIFVDGGSDAYFRADDWPRRVPTTAIPRYLYRLAAFSRAARHRDR